MADGEDFLSSSPPAIKSDRAGRSAILHSYDSHPFDFDDAEQLLRSSDGESAVTRSFSQPCEDDLLNYAWGQLCSPEEQTRRNAISNIVKILQNAIRDSRIALLQAHLPRILRIAYECPFTDISNALKELLDVLRTELEKRQIVVPDPPKVSRFFKDSIIPIDTDMEPQCSMFRELFLLTGRVSHLDRVLAWHPTFHEKFLESYNFIMRAPGPLPLHLRNYIAILASSRFKCSYLVHQQEEEFIVNGGDPHWLQGVEYSDPKIKKLLEVNAILAHQPWLLNKGALEKLIRSDDDPRTRWSTAELVHAFVVMATFRALASIILGLGITNEIDFIHHTPEISTGTSSPVDYADISSDDQASQTNEIIEKLKKAINYTDHMDTSAELRRQQFEAAGSEPEPAKSSEIGSAWGDFEKYIGPYDLQHQDFDVRSKEYDVFHVDEYSWEEQGFELVQRYFAPTAATLLDNVFRTIYGLTYNRFNEYAVDTAPFRQSVWYYVHRIFGVLHDDYDYSQVNMYMNRQMKAWVKNMVVRPFVITIADINLGYHLQPQEKCHLALLASEARKQAELLYGLHALMMLMSA